MQNLCRATWACTSAIGDPTFAELLIDCEEDRTLRAVLIGMPTLSLDLDRTPSHPHCMEDVVDQAWVAVR